MSSKWVLVLVLWSDCGVCIQLKSNGELAKIEKFASSNGIEVKRLDLHRREDLAGGNFDKSFPRSLPSVVGFFPFFALLPRENFMAGNVNGIIRYGALPDGRADGKTNLANSAGTIDWIKRITSQNPTPTPPVSSYMISQSFYHTDAF